MKGGGQRPSLRVLVGVEVPEPVFTPLEALHISVAAVLPIAAGVLARRRVTATDVTARGAATKVEPPPGRVGPEALRTASPRWHRIGVDLTSLGHEDLPDVR